MTEDEALASLLLDDDDDDDDWLDREIAKRRNDVRVAQARGVRLDGVMEGRSNALAEVVDAILEKKRDEENFPNRDNEDWSGSIQEESPDGEDHVSTEETREEAQVSSSVDERLEDQRERDEEDAVRHAAEVATLLQSPAIEKKKTCLVEKLVKSAFVGKFLSRRWIRRRLERERFAMRVADLESRKFEESRRYDAMIESREVEAMRAEENSTRAFVSEERRRAQKAYRAAKNAIERKERDEAIKVAEIARDALEKREECRRLIERRMDAAVDAACKAAVYSSSRTGLEDVARVAAGLAALMAQDYLSAKGTAERAIDEEIRRISKTRVRKVLGGGAALARRIFEEKTIVLARPRTNENKPEVCSDREQCFVEEKRSPFAAVQDNNPLLERPISSRDVFEACVEGVTSAECLRGSLVRVLRVNVNLLQSIDFVRDMPRLNVLEARDNRLTSICTHGVAQVDVDVNAISRVETTPSLLRLSAADNRLRELPTLKSLTSLDVAGNCLGPTLEIGDTASLRFLDLSRNSLRSLCLKKGKFLKTLAASNNLLRSFATDLAVETLRLNDNRLAAIRSNCFELHVAHNSFESFSQALLPNVTKLDCSHNSLQTIPFSSLSQVSAAGNPFPATRLADAVETALNLWRKNNCHDAKTVVFARRARIIDGQPAPFDDHQMNALELISKLFPARCSFCRSRIAPTSTLFFFKERNVRCKCGTLFTLPSVASSKTTWRLLHASIETIPVLRKSRYFAARSIQTAWKLFSHSPRRLAVVKMQTVVRGRTLRTKLRNALNHARYVDHELDTILAQTTAVPQEEEEVPCANFFDNKWRLPPLLHTRTTHVRRKEEESPRREEKQKRPPPPPLPPPGHAKEATRRFGRGRRRQKKKPAWLAAHSSSC